MNPRWIANLLVHNGTLSQQVASDLFKEASLHSKRMDTIIFERKLLTHEKFYQSLSEALGKVYYDISNFEPAPETLQLIPARFAQLYGTLPLFVQDQILFIALSDPSNSLALENLRFALDVHFEQVLADVDRVDSLIRIHYGCEKPEPYFAKEGPPKNSASDLSPYFSFPDSESAPIAQFVHLILEKAIQSRASDIHLEPFEAELKIRYRVDGTLYAMVSPPPHLAPALISYVKVLANLDISEHRIPQDGRIQHILNGRSIDLRVSTLPTVFGESTVLRILDRAALDLDLEMLGMPQEIFRSVMETVQKPNGIFIVTGPTGSGKTTTLYSCLRKINTIGAKLLTVEDPVEYEIDGIVQVPIQENIGLTFSKTLRAFLRQDPDCIMIGEIRDQDTARTAVQAALTGHLVLSTLHTNDTVSTITRLLNFGIEPFLISATLEGVLAQRLVRKICPHCRTSRKSPLEEQSFYYGKGCQVCNHTGYLGRKGIFEFLTLTSPIRELINDRCAETMIRKKSKELGLTTLKEEGLRAVCAGHSTVEEITKYT
ncbi:MAG: pilus assembly protein PilB [Verrucomicrobia bacterium]|nr:MAG: pilus assembly protein PilB [Verrucomicrobiota bacterium]